MKMKLTDAALKKYQPKTARDEIFDRDVGGFGVRITPTSKAFFFVRRVRGEKVRFSLGTYPPKDAPPNSAAYTSLAEARKRAFDILDKIKKGADPREERDERKREKAEHAENTFAHIAKRFIDEYAEGKKRPLSKRTVAGYRWALQGVLTKKWEPRPLIEIADKDIIRIIDKLEGEQHFAGARLWRAYLSKFFNWAVGKRLIRDNPIRSVALASTPSDFKRDRLLFIPELQSVLAAADSLVRVTTRKDGRVNRIGETQRAFIWTLILTGQRRTETALMKWADLDLEGDKPLWRIPAENTKNRQAHEVALSDEAVAIISQLERVGEYVFTTDGKTRISGYSKVKTALDKAIAKTEADAELKPNAKIKPWRFHDLRRSVSTGLGELGFAPHIIEMVLNHISGEKGGVSGLYNRSRYEADCRRALAAWALAVTAKDAGDNVVQMRAATS